MKLSIVLLISTLCVCYAAVSVTNTDKLTTISGSKFKVEVMRIVGDPVYDFYAKFSSPNTPATAPPTGKTATKENTSPFIKAIEDGKKAHYSPDSFNVRITRVDTNEVVFTFAEGRRDKDFLKMSTPSKSGIDAALVDALVAELSGVSGITNEHLKKLVPGLPALFKKAFNDGNKKAGAARGGGAAAAAFRQMFLNPSKTPASFLETGNVNYRYDIGIYIGTAFGYIYGAHHSASVIYRKNAATDDLVRVDYNNNHGRGHDGSGMTFKCLHRGAGTIAATAAQPENWDCTTGYFPVWCFAPLSGHNCNANAQFHINISDNPTAPPSTSTGICANSCPATSPEC